MWSSIGFGGFALNFQVQFLLGGATLRIWMRQISRVAAFAKCLRWSLTIFGHAVILIVAYGPFQYGSRVWVIFWDVPCRLAVRQWFRTQGLDRARPIPIVLDRLPTLSVKLSAFGISWFRQTHPDKNSNVLLTCSFFVYLSALRALQAEPCCTMPVLFYDLQAGRITSACLVYSWWHSHNIPMMDELS